jgi:hypothetical protein
MATSALDKRGLKRICMSCSTRFYDFNKRPIICPNCETEFTGDMKVRTRRPRLANDDDAVAKTAPANVEEMEIIKDDDEDDVVDDETVSLDDVEEDDDDTDDAEETLDADLDLDEEDLDDDDLDDDDDDDDDDEDED